MTHLSKETRELAGKYDSIMFGLFDNYMNTKCIIEKSELEKEIEKSLMQMSEHVDKKCYAIYEEIYYSIKNVRNE